MFNRNLFCKRLVVGVLGAFCFLSIGATALAGPWSKDPGHFYMKLGGNAMYSFQGVFGEKDVQFLNISPSFYGEVGLVYGLQLNAYLPYSISRSIGENAFYEVGGFGDSIIGLQWTPPPLQKILGFPIALKIDAKVPMYDPQKAHQIKELTDQGIQSRFPLRGLGQIDLTFWLSLGGSIPNTRLYMYADVGFRYRSNQFLGNPEYSYLNISPLNAFAFFTQIGYNFGFMVLSLNNQGTVPVEPDQDGRTVVSPTFLMVGLSAYIPLYKKTGHTLALEVGFDYTYLARNSSQPINGSLGVSYSW